MRRIALVSLLFILSVSVYAQKMYHWKDSDGRVHYTDNPTVANQKNASAIDKQQLKQINMLPAQYEGEDLSGRRQQEAHLMQQRAEQIEAQARQRQRCERVYNYIRQLKESPPRLMRKKEDGSRYYLSDEEIAAYITKEEAEYRQQCGGL